MTQKKDESRPSAGTVASRLPSSQSAQYIPTIQEAQDDSEPEIASTDGYRAQLDLANAYQSMGEKAGAKEILESLLDCEDQVIREEAERRLENL